MKTHGQHVGQELWLRCPFCGDSGKSSVHFSVHVVKRTYHCFRCGAGGKLTSEEYMEFTGEVPGLLSTGDDGTDPTDVPVQPGAGSNRPSELDRYHSTWRGVLWDVFLSRTPRGETTGVHMRGPDKRSLSYGRRLFGYAGGSLSPRGFLRIVEGPYDVVDPAHDVCTFGLPSRRQLHHLRGYPLRLCPDGDVWAKPDVLRAYLRSAVSTPGLKLEGIEYIADGQDPDEVPSCDRYLITGAELAKLLGSIVDESHRARGAWGFRKDRTSEVARGCIRDADYRPVHLLP